MTACLRAALHLYQCISAPCGLPLPYRAPLLSPAPCLLPPLLFPLQNPANLFDPTSVTAGTYASAQVIWDAFAARYDNGKRGIALMMIPLLGQFFCCMASVTSNSRMVYAFSRDGAIPFSRFWHKVHPSTRTPVNAVWFR